MAKRYPRWSKWLGAAALLLLLVLWLANAFLLPAIVRAKFAATLGQLNAGPVSFRLDHASLWASGFSDVRVGDIHVPAMDVRYRPLTVIGGNLDSIDIVGAQIRVDLDHRTSLLGSSTASSGTARKPAGALPFQRVGLSTCILVVQHAGREAQFPFGGQLTTAPEGGSKIQFKAILFNTPLDIQGVFDPARRSADLTATSDGLEVASVLAVLPQPRGMESVHAGGQLGLRVNYHLRDGAQRTTASVKVSDGWLAARTAGQLIVARPVELSVNTALDRDFHPAELDVALTAANVALNGNVSAALDVRARRVSPEKTSFTVALNNPQWSLRLSDGNFTGLLNGAAQISASATCSASGRMPPSASDALLRQGIDVNALGRGELNGKLTARLPGTAKASASDWHVDLADGQFTLGRGAIRLTNAGVVLEHLSALLPITASAGPSGAELVLRQDANVAATEIQSRWSGPQRLRPIDPKVDLADLTLLGQDAHLLATWGKQQPFTWKAHVPSIRLRLAPANIEIPSGPRLDSVAAIIRARADADANGVAVTLDDGSWFGLNGAHVPHGATPIEVGAFYFQSGTPNASKSPHLALSGNGATLDAHVELRSAWKNPFTASMGNQSAQLNGVAFDASMSRHAKDARPAIVATLSFDRGAVALAPGVALTELSARLPMSYNVKASPGSFAARSVKVGPDHWPGPSGTILLADGRLEAGAKWSPLKECAFAAQGWADTKGLGGTPRADLKVTLPRFTLSDPNEVGSLVSAAKDMQITGTFAANAHVSLDRGLITPTISLSVDGANFQSKQYTADIQNISTAILITSFTPLSTPGNQRITVGHATIGKLDIADGSLVFSVESARSILAEKSEWGWSGGKLYTDAFRVDPRNPQLNLVAYAENVSIAQVLKLAAGPGAGGAGTLYGRLPVKVNWPTISFGDGFLYAAPGSGDLQLGSDASTKVDQMLSQDPRFSADSNSRLVRSRIVAALRKFHYDVLKVDFKNNGDNLNASVRLDGYGEVDKDKQELHLEVNAHGFDELLRDVLVIKRLFGK